MTPEWKLQIPAGIDTPEGRALLAVLERWDTVLPVERVLVWHIDSTVPDALPHLAETMGLEGMGFTGAAPRALLKQGVRRLKRAGTGGALKAAVRALGYTDVDFSVLEDTAIRHDGTIRRNGQQYYGLESHWAHFFVVLTLVDDAARPSLDALRELWRVVDAWRPMRSPFSIVVHVADAWRTTYRAMPTMPIPD